MSIQTSLPIPQPPTQVPSSAVATTAPVAQDATKAGGSSETPFGPDYILDLQAHHPAPKGPAGTVPFASPPGPGADLAALPPLQPIGAAALTELSLSQSLQPPKHQPFAAETSK